VGEAALPLSPVEGSKRDVSFKTAADVFSWVKMAMPPAAPGSLSDDDYVNVLAFALHESGVEREEALRQDNAAALVLHE
jgi:hypothetical protein